MNNSVPEAAERRLGAGTGMTGKRVWVTRTEPFNRLTVKRLAAAGYEAIGAPVLDVELLAVRAVAAVPDALIFTSLNGVRLHRFFPALAGLPVFAVGDHSARFARARGYRNVISASGNVRDLCRSIEAGFEGGADLLHIGALRTAGDLAGMLRPEFRVRKLAVYDVRERDPRQLDRVCGGLDKIDLILIHSPRAGRHAAELIRAAMPDWPGTAHCISAAVAACFHQLPRVRIHVAERPYEASLLALFRQERSSLAVPPSGGRGDPAELHASARPGFANGAPS